MAQNTDKKFLYGYSENPEYQSLGKNIPRYTNHNLIVYWSRLFFFFKVLFKLLFFFFLI